MDIISIILINVLRIIIAISNVYLFIIFIVAVLSILSLLGVVNIFNQESFASKLYFNLRYFLSPLTNFVAKFVPQIGLIDLSFVVVLLMLYIIRDVSYAFIIKLQSGMFFF